MVLTDYNKKLRYLDKIPQFLPGTGISRAEKMLDKAGTRYDGFKIIHVAGSNGKGSTCAYLESILRSNGYKTGLFTSPHLADIRERIRIDGNIISEELFERCFDYIYDIETKLAQDNVRLAYFDYLLGIALEAFRAEKVDYVILETGLGGRFDATNAVKGKVLSVIATISLEHTAILGDSLKKIAFEKSGIIAKKVPVVYLDSSKEASEVIKKIADDNQAEMYPVKDKDIAVDKIDKNHIDFSLHNGYHKDNCYKIATCAVYQTKNCALALCSAKVLEKQGLISLSEKDTKTAVWQAFWPGRMEQLSDRIYVDGAHNPEGIKAFIQTLQMVFNGSGHTLLFSVVNDKAFEPMIRQLCESGLFDRYVVTQIQGDRLLAGKYIQDIFKKYTDNPVYEYEDLEDAFVSAVKLSHDNDGDLFCAGSLYLTGDIKKIMQKKKGFTDK